MFFAKFNKSCLITYLGVIFGVLSMYFSFTKIVNADVIDIRYSLACLVIAGICDMFDGKFARMCKRTEEEKEFGIQLDSLADTFCFLVVPVVFMLSLGMNNILCIIAYSLLILCGISRLGYFNIKADLDKVVKTYSGLPVTSTAISFPIIGLLYSVVSLSTFCNICLVLTLLTAFLFVFNVKIPKLKGIAYVITPILALILVLLLVIF